MFTNSPDTDPFLSTDQWASNNDNPFPPLLGYNNLSPYHLPIPSQYDSPECNINNIDAMELDPMTLNEAHDCFYDLQYDLEQDDASPSSSNTIRTPINHLTYSYSDPSSLSSNLMDINPNPMSDYPQNISHLNQSIQSNINANRVSGTTLNGMSEVPQILPQSFSQLPTNEHHILQPKSPNIHNINPIKHAPAPPIITTLTNSTNTVNVQNILSLPELPFIPLYSNTCKPATPPKCSPMLSLNTSPSNVSGHIVIPTTKMHSNNVQNFQSNGGQISIKKPFKIKAKKINKKPTTKINETKALKIPKPIKSKIITRPQSQVNYPNMTDKKEQNEEIRRIKNPKTRRKTTAIACIKCWKAKTRCGVQRPCKRCVRIGCADECVDRPLSSRSRQNVKPPKPTKPTKRKYNKSKNKCVTNQTQPCTNQNDSYCKQVPMLSSFVFTEQSSIPPVPLIQPSTITNNIHEPSLALTSLSAIIGGFNKQSNNVRKTPINNEFELPPAINISNEYKNDSFEYLPILTQYQICQKSYCNSCYAVLKRNNEHSNNLHLQTPHTYGCPNKDCDRKFVLQNHLSIHLKICKQSKKLSTNLTNCKEINEMSDDEFGKCIQLSIEAPVKNYYSKICYRDVHPPQHWIEEQYKFKQLLSELMNKSNKRDEYIHVPLFKKRKISS